MANGLDDLNTDQLDVFKEIGNIGSGNAATALAKILGKKMVMDVPEVKVIPFQEIAELLNGPENIIVGTLINMSGDLNGYIMMVQECEDARDLCALLLGEENVAKSSDPESFTEETISVLEEIANILVGAYLSAIASLTNLTIIPTVPEINIDMAGAILSIPAIEYGKIGDSVLFLQTHFSDSEGNEDVPLAGNFFLIPDLESYKILMKSLGVAD